jgi:hypothetical protein
MWAFGLSLVVFAEPICWFYDVKEFSYIAFLIQAALAIYTDRLLLELLP